MNILVVNHYAGSPELGMEFRPYYLASKWKDVGHSVEVVAGTFSHIRNKNPGRFGRQSIDGVNYLWLWVNKYKGNGLLRFISMLVFVAQLILLSPWLSFKSKPAIVVASSTYTIDIFPAWLIAKFSGAKLVFEIHDLWPMSPMLIGNMSRYNPFIMLMRLGEWFAYRFSDKIISILPGTYEHVAKDGVERAKWAHVPNGVLIEQEVSNMPSNLAKLIEAKKSEGYFLVGYSGSMGAANALNEFIDAANIIAKEYPEYKICFFLVGDGTEKGSLMQRSISPDIIFHGRIDKNSVPNFLSQMDILSITLSDKEIYKYGVSSNKMFDYMLAKKPILQASNAGNDLVSDVKCGIVVEAENARAIAEGIIRFVKMPKSDLQKMGEIGYEYVVKNHNYKSLADNFLRYCCEE